MKKKTPRFSAVKEVKAMSREKLGIVPAKRVLPDPRLKPEKYPKQALQNEE